MPATSRRRAMRAPAWAVALTGGMLALAGCGGPGGLASEPAAQILHASLAAMRSARSVEVAETVSANGSIAAKLHYWLFSDGDADGSFVDGSAVANAVTVGSTTYLRGNLAYWREQGITNAHSLARLSTCWVSTTVNGGPALASLTELERSLATAATDVSTGAPRRVDAQAAIGLRSSKGGTLWVATAGKPYPVEVTGVEGATISFAGWDQGTVPTAPAGAIAEAPLIDASS